MRSIAQDEMNEPNLISLSKALDSGGAVYAADQMVPLPESSIRAATRAQARLSDIFGKLPTVRVSDQGVQHETSGTAFVGIGMGHSSHLVGCISQEVEPLRPGTPVDIVTGSCMFGLESIVGYVGGQSYSLTDPHEIATVQGPIERLEIDERLHVYEAETVSRLSGFIADTVRVLGDTPVRVTVHIPVPEYLLYGVSLYVRGCITADMLADYSAAVRRRGPMLSKMFKERLSGPTAQVEIGSPLSWIDEINISALEPGAILDHLFDALSARDELWNNLVATCTRSDFADVNYSSYVYEYLSAAMRVQVEGRRLLIIENPEENPIYLKALKHQGATGVSIDRATALYIHPKVVVTQKANIHYNNLLSNCKNGFDQEVIAAAVKDYV